MIQEVYSFQFFHELNEVEATLQHYDLLLYIRVASVDRADQIQHRLRVHRLAVMHVRRTIPTP